MSAHAKLGASNAHRWLVCSGSVTAEAGMPDQTSSFAQEGTTAHELAEQALLRGTEMLDIFYDQDMAEYVRVYVDHVLRLADGADSFDVETRVHYDDWVDGGFGTADAIIIRGDKLHVCDLKYGKGVRVDAQENPQGMLYALGAWSMMSVVFDIKRVKIHIIQPRLDHISDWEISVDALLRWAEWVKQQAEKTKADDAPRVAGEKQCRFCKAKASCSELKRFTETAILSEFDDLDNMPKANMLTDQQMAQALAAKPLIEAWLSAVEAEVKSRLTAGFGFTGYKLVEGRSNRQWSDEWGAAARLVDLLGNDKAYTPPKLISPAQAEKALGKKRSGQISDLITKPAGAPTLAPEADPRPAINVTVDDFDTCADA
jgi:hypothetical protein